jgi:hypothetical protein
MTLYIADFSGNEINGSSLVPVLEPNEYSKSDPMYLERALSNNLASPFVNELH